MTLSDLVRTRLEAGAREYGDKSEQRHPIDLLREIREELADVLGWLAIVRKACPNHGIDPATVDEHEPALRVLMETADDILASMREALGHE